MNSEAKNRLKYAIQQAILNEGKIDGSNDIVLQNTSVIEALLEIAVAYSSVYSFENYTPQDLADDHAIKLKNYIEAYRLLKMRGKLPFNIVTRRHIN